MQANMQQSSRFAIGVDRQVVRLRWRVLPSMAALVLVSASAYSTRAASTPDGGGRAPDAVDATPGEDIDYLRSLSFEELLNVKVVTASRTAESAALAPASMVVFSADDIARHGWRSLAEILSYVPGLYVIDSFSQASLSVRGVNGGLAAGTRLVKIMINGVAVNFRPELSSTLGPEFLPAEAIERVEIAKGPLSALYGANAFLATVNVLTRSPTEGVHAEIAARTDWQQSSAHAGYGDSWLVSYGSATTDIMAAGTADHFDRSGVGIEQTFARQNGASFQPLFATKSRDDISQPSGEWLRLDVKLPDIGRFTVQGGQQVTDTKAEFLLNSTLTHKSRLVLQNVWTSLEYKNEWTSRLSSDAMVGWSTGGPQASDTRLYLSAQDASYYVPHYDYSAVNAGAGLQASFDLFLLRIGTDFERDVEGVLLYNQVTPGSSAANASTSGLVTRRTMATNGIYLAGEVRPPLLEGVRVIGNLRYDRLTYGPVVLPWLLSWRAAVTYEYSHNFAAKIFAGRAFQGPSGVLMFAQSQQFGFGNNDNVIGQYTMYQNGQTDGKILKPQVVTSVEAVVSGALFSAVSLEAGAFYQQLDQRIEFARTTTNFVAGNDSRAADAVGLEASARLAINRFAARLAGSYMHQQQQEREIGSLVDQPDAIPLFPVYQIIAGADVAVPEARLRLSLLARLVGVRSSSDANALANNLKHYDLPAWHSVDAALSTHDWRPIAPLETVVTLGLRNILDERHSEPGSGGYDLPSVHRTLFAELRQKF